MLVGKQFQHRITICFIEYSGQKERLALPGARKSNICAPVQIVLPHKLDRNMPKQPKPWCKRIRGKPWQIVLESASHCTPLLWCIRFACRFACRRSSLRGAGQAGLGQAGLGQACVSGLSLLCSHSTCSRVRAQITLNLSTKNVVAQVIIWIVIVNPVTKFALDLSPVPLPLPCRCLAAALAAALSLLVLFLPACPSVAI